MKESINFVFGLLLHCLPSCGNICSRLAAPWPGWGWALCWGDHSSGDTECEGPVWLGAGVLLWKKSFASLIRAPNWTSALSSLGLLSCFSCVRLFATLRTVACQAPLSMEFTRREYWSVLPCPPLRDLPDPGIKPKSLTSAGGVYHQSHLGNPFLSTLVLKEINIQVGLTWLVLHSPTTYYSRADLKGVCKNRVFLS